MAELGRAGLSTTEWGLASVLRESRSRAEAITAAGTGSLAEAARSAAPPRDFEAALRAPGVSLIAEMKRRSPSGGELRPRLDPAATAADFARGGAAAISVLTEPSFFGGSMADLAAARDAGPLPVLRKDFLVDPIQVLEARAGGADAVLLIVRALPRDVLRACLEASSELAIAALVEVHDESDLEVAADLGATLIGINNRDLDRLSTDLETSHRLVGKAPPDALLVAESGIRFPFELARLGALGYAAALVGEALMRAPDTAAAVAQLAGAADGDR